jgi:hypothetical protein
LFPLCFAFSAGCISVHTRRSHPPIAWTSNVRHTNMPGSF